MRKYCGCSRSRGLRDDWRCLCLEEMGHVGDVVREEAQKGRMIGRDRRSALGRHDHGITDAIVFSKLRF